MMSNQKAAFVHIKVPCDDGGGYVAEGDVLFPLSWNTEEKRKAAALK